MCSCSLTKVTWSDGRCGRTQCMGSQEAWLESVAMPSATISLRGDLFMQALGLRHCEMLEAQRCGYNVV